MSPFVCREKCRTRETSSLIGLALRFLYPTQGNPTPQTGFSSGGVAEIRIPRLPYFASGSRLLSTPHPCPATSEYPAWSLGVPCHTRAVRLLIRRVMGIGGRVRSYILVLVGRRGSHILPHRHGRKEKPGAQRERGLEPGTYCSTTISPTPVRLSVRSGYVSPSGLSCASPSNHIFILAPPPSPSPSPPPVLVPRLPSLSPLLTCAALASISWEPERSPTPSSATPSPQIV